MRCGTSVKKGDRLPNCRRNKGNQEPTRVPVLLFHHLGIMAVAVALALTCQACAQDTSAPPANQDEAAEPVAEDDRQEQVAQVAALPGTGDSQSAANSLPVADKEHPLAPALRIAQASLAHINKEIKDYSCVLVKHEQFNGELIPKEHIFLKIRHEPLSIYMYFQGPEEVKGRECLYVAGQNNNKMIAHEASGLITMTVHLDPTGYLAMRGQRYPITEVGIKNLAVRLIDVAQHDLQFGECEVKFRDGNVKLSKNEKRDCTIIEVLHPNPKKHFRFHLARIAIDNELQIPIHYEAYLWPTKPGGKMVLDETYTYTKIKVNQGLTDRDFDPENPDYNF